MASDVLKRVNGDTKLAKKLTPNFEFGCKRILMMNDFIPMFLKSNAHLGKLRFQIRYHLLSIFK